MPITLYVDKLPYLKYPADFFCSTDLLYNENIYPNHLTFDESVNGFSLVHSKLFEYFLLLELDSSKSILIGPFLTKNFSSAILTENNLPNKTRGKLERYLNGIGVLKEQEIYYIALLFFDILKNREYDPIYTAKKAYNTNLPDTYVVNKFENRLANFHHSPLFLEEELQQRISSGNLAGALDTLVIINSNKRATLADTPLRSLKNSVICSSTIFARAAINGGVPSPSALTLSDTYIFEIEHASTLEALTRIEVDMLVSFVKQVILFNENAYSNPIARVMSFIDENLTEKITLEKLSDVAFLHPNYLSKRFKKEVGISLSRYILKRKVEESKHLLLCTEMPVSDVSVTYGFSSQSYYIKVFKEFIGDTPSNLRKGYIKAEDNLVQ